MIDARKKEHGAVEVADPNLGGAGVEIKGAFFTDLGVGIGWRNNLDADIWSALEERELWNVLFALRGQPGDIGGFDACSGRDWALRQRAAVGEKLPQKEGNFDLALAVERSGRRAHEDVAVLVGLDAVGEPGEFGISQELGPSVQIKPGLRLKIGKLNRNRHAGKIRQKWKNA